MPKDNHSEQKSADIAKQRGVVAAGIQDSDTKKKFIAAQGEGKMSDQDLDAQTYRVRNQIAAGAVPTMHDGGTVKKDGLHNLEKGEVVIAKDKVKNMKNAKGLMAGMAEAAEEKSEPKDSKKEEKSEKKPAGKHRHKTTMIEHHANGSHTVRHIPHPSQDGSPTQEISYAAPDMDALHAGMDENLGGGPAPAEAAATGAPQA